jgi:hypothetical protein
VGVAIRQTGHQHGVAAIDNFVARLRHDAAADADNPPIRNPQVTCLNPRRVKLN